VLKAANIGKKTGAEHDAERRRCATPNTISHLDLGEITEVWRRGSVGASWLLDLTPRPSSPMRTSRSRRSRFRFGRGRWTVKAAIDEAVPAPCSLHRLYARFSSRGEADFQNKVLSAMRFGFGGHLETPKT